MSQYIMSTFEKVVAAWRTAGICLDISVQAQFSLGSGICPAVAYLPLFGGPNGMVLGLMNPPSFTTDKALYEAASRAGFYCSFINSEEYCEFNEKRFKESLADWGYFGDELSRPAWLK